MSAAAIHAEPAPADPVAALVMELAQATAESEAARIVWEAAAKRALVAAGHRGDVLRRVVAAVGPGESVTVKVGKREAVTVTVPAAGSGLPVSVARSRIVA